MSQESDYAAVLSRIGLASIGFAVLARALFDDEIEDFDDIIDWHNNAVHLIVASDKELVPRPDFDPPYLDLTVHLVTLLRSFEAWTADYLRQRTGLEELYQIEELFDEDSRLNSEEFEEAMRWAWKIAPETDWSELFSG